MTEPYGHIFLQWGHRSDWDSLTWCQDRIDDDDVEYVRKDLCNSTLKDAAPDLLEVLIEVDGCLQEYIEFLDAERYSNDDEVKLLVKVQAIIAKAKGEK